MSPQPFGADTSWAQPADKIDREQIAGATLPVLTSLPDKSLLRGQADGRYHIHELVRQYAQARFHATPSDAQDVHRVFGTYYFAFLNARFGRIIDKEQREAAAE